jgi:hypothetical protein
MKCSHPDCNRGIGLVSYRSGWFGKGRYCSKQCRYAFLAKRPKRSRQERSATTYFEWLFSQPNLQPKLMPAIVRKGLPKCASHQKS